MDAQLLRNRAGYTLDRDTEMPRGDKHGRASFVVKVELRMLRVRVAQILSLERHAARYLNSLSIHPAIFIRKSAAIIGPTSSGNPARLSAVISATRLGVAAVLIQIGRRKSGIDARLSTCGVASRVDLDIFRFEIASMVKIVHEPSLRWSPIQPLLRERAGRDQV